MKGLMKPHDEIETDVAGAQEGDREAFDRLATKFRPGLTAWVRSKMGAHLQGHIEIDDILQETFVWAFKSIQRLEWKGEKAFDRWLCAIARHVILKASSSRSRHHHLELDRDVSHKGPSASKAAVRNERFDRLEKALEQLSDEHRRVILLSRIDGLSMKEIAARMERSPDAVMKLLRRALKNLKDTFGDTESLGLPARALRTEGEERDAR